MTDALLLQVRNVAKKFKGAEAVGGVSFELGSGETLGLIGPNGSGKTTLVNLITGFVRPDRGEILFRGRLLNRRRPDQIARLGVVRTFQMARPYLGLKALENVVVPLFSSRLKRLPGGRYGGRETVALDLLEEVGFERESLVPFKPAGALPHGYLKRLELARCLALRPELLILDEIFSGLSLAEVAGLMPIITRFQAEGVALVMIEHRLRELFKVVDRVLVMNFGRVIAAGTPAQVMASPEVKEAYLGAE
ncbi:MAG: ATP-binding cassette domain-containing protein [Thermodesulfobacteriota bacterium]